VFFTAALILEEIHPPGPKPSSHRPTIRKWMGSTGEMDADLWKKSNLALKIIELNVKTCGEENHTKWENHLEKKIWSWISRIEH